MRDDTLPSEQDWRPVGPPVQKFDEGLRVDQFLAQKYPFLSRAGWKNMIERREVLANILERSFELRASYKVKEGDRFFVYRPETLEPDVDEGIYAIWEDSGVMAVFKPGNLPMHESGPFRKKTFSNLLAREFGEEWSAVHRLDRETSGIVLCAATPELRQKLADGFMAREVDKEYLAIANGIPEQSIWQVDQPIGGAEESEIRIKKWVDPDGLNALTDFHVLGKVKDHPNGDFCLLKALPKTGRTNQIRVHAAFSGHHLVGDKMYHPDEGVFLDFFESRDLTKAAEKTGFYRCCLHAARLEFHHPVRNERVTVESPLPPDMGDLWLSLLYATNVRKH